MSTPNFDNVNVEPDEDAPTAHELLVATEVRVLRIRAEAKARHEHETAEAAKPDTAPLLVDGATFLLDIPVGVPALWGAGDAVLSARGESCMLVGPPGVGKTTLATQVVLAGLGIGGTSVLGLPVAPMDRVLILAMDRPQQIARAMARRVTAADRSVLSERLVVWKGPPPADLAKHPGTLLRLAQEAGADVVVVDSLKDAAIGLSEDEVGAGYNRARQLALAAGIELIELHHTRKPAPGGAAPNLSDVYGSTWLTSGAGSVIMLDGQAGDPVVSFRHLKQPAAEIGPYRLLHDQTAGEMTVQHGTDLIELARVAGQVGLTARDAAKALFEKDAPTRTDVEKARRRLDALAKSGDLTCQGGTPRSGGGTAPSAWFPAFASSHGGSHGPTFDEGSHAPEKQSRSDTNSLVKAVTGAVTAVTAQGSHESHPLLTGVGGDPDVPEGPPEPAVQRPQTCPTHGTPTHEGQCGRCSLREVAS
jgi:hypothetical protein